MSKHDDTMEQQLILCLGTNYRHAHHLARAKSLLAGHFGHVSFTRSLRTKAIGIDSDDFENCMAMTTTTDDYETVRQTMKNIERECGDTPMLRQRNIIAMDIDIMRLGHQLYHERDWLRPYVQTLHSELPTGQPTTVTEET